MLRSRAIRRFASLAGAIVLAYPGSILSLRYELAKASLQRARDKTNEARETLRGAVATEAAEARASAKR